MLRFPPRRLLVAVDATKASMLAWGAAKEIAARFGASLEAVWCVPPEPADVAGLTPSSLSAARRAGALKRLRAKLGPGARVHAVNGEPVAALRRLVRARCPDLLVMGSRPRGRLEHWAQGSVAEAMLRDAPCPVLVLRRAWRAPAWVLAPVHGAPYARRGLQAAALVARAYKGRLALLEVVAAPEGRTAAACRIGELAGRLPGALVAAVRPVSEVRVGRPVEEILAAEKDCDLVVLTAHRKSLLGDAVLGTTVERVLRHSRRAVLAVPSRAGG